MSELLPLVSRSYPPESVECQDLVFRVVDLSEIDKLRVARQASLNELKTFMTWVHRPFSEQETAERIIQVKTEYLQGKSFEYGIFHKETDELLGCCSVDQDFRLNPNCLDIGYWIASSHTNKGYATLATKVLTCLSFECLEADRVQISANIKNQASLRVIEKCGFKFEGQARNFYPKPTQCMIDNGYTAERTVSLFSLIEEDKKELLWYSDCLKRIKIHTQFKKSFLLHEL